MIARSWSGRTPADLADDYIEYLRRTGVTDLQATPGNKGVYVMRRFIGDEAEFTLISLWESMDVIKGFAGDDVERAVYYPEDERFLNEMASRVSHYEVLVFPE